MMKPRTFYMVAAAM